jgi:hypothetical protein
MVIEYTSSILGISLTTLVGVLFLSDLFFALIPLTFLHRLRRPLQERIFIGALMAVGLLAVATSIAKLYLLYKFWFRSDSTSYNYNYVNFLLPTHVEIFITIIGATIPSLNSLMIRRLRKCGFMGEQRNNVWGLGGRVNLVDVDVRESVGEHTSQSRAEVQKVDVKGQKKRRFSSIGSEATVVEEDKSNFIDTTLSGKTLRARRPSVLESRSN